MSKHYAPQLPRGWDGPARACVFAEDVVERRRAVLDLSIRCRRCTLSRSVHAAAVKNPLMHHSETEMLMSLYNTCMSHCNCWWLLIKIAKVFCFCFFFRAKFQQYSPTATKRRTHKRCMCWLRACNRCWAPFDEKWSAFLGLYKTQARPRCQRTCMARVGRCTSSF